MLIRETPSLDYDQWRAEAEAEVVYWRYAYNPLWTPDPYDCLVRSGSRAAEITQSDQQGRPGTYAEGVDQHEQVRVQRFYMGIPGALIETFYRRDPSMLRWVQFDYHKPKGVLNYCELQSVKGTPQKMLFCGHHSFGQKSYAYSRGRLIQVNTFRCEHATRKEVLERYDLAWTREGRLDAVNLTVDGASSKCVWRRRKRSESLVQLLTRYERVLLAEIPKAIRGLGLTETAYAVILNYDLGNHLVPPTVSIGLESERQVWMRDSALDPVGLLWNSSAFRLGHVRCPGLAEPDASEAARMIEQLRKSYARSKIVVRMLRRVALGLQRMDWSGILPRTEDFLVLATAFENDDLEEALLDAVGHRGVQKLRSDRLLP